MLQLKDKHYNFCCLVSYVKHLVNSRNFRQRQSIRYLRPKQPIIDNSKPQMHPIKHKAKMFKRLVALSTIVSLCASALDIWIQAPPSWGSTSTFPVSVDSGATVQELINKIQSASSISNTSNRRVAGIRYRGEVYLATDPSLLADLGIGAEIQVEVIPLPLALYPLADERGIDFVPPLLVHPDNQSLGAAQMHVFLGKNGSGAGVYLSQHDMAIGREFTVRITESDVANQQMYDEAVAYLKMMRYKVRDVSERIYQNLGGRCDIHHLQGVEVFRRSGAGPLPFGPSQSLDEQLDAFYANRDVREVVISSGFITCDRRTWKLHGDVRNTSLIEWGLENQNRTEIFHESDEADLVIRFLRN